MIFFKNAFYCKHFPYCYVIVYYSLCYLLLSAVCYLLILSALGMDVGFQIFSIVEDLCDCDCDYDAKIDYWSNITNQVAQYNELSATLAEIKRQLAVETRNLSSFLNSKRSATDNRESAVFTGIVGALFIVFVSSALILIDLSRLIINNQRKK